MSSFNLDKFPVNKGDQVHHFQYGLCTVLRVAPNDAIVVTSTNTEVVMVSGKEWTWHNISSIRPPKCSPAQWQKLVSVIGSVSKEFLSE